MQQCHDAVTTKPVNTLNALFQSIAAKGELTDDYIMLLTHFVGQPGGIFPTTVLGALRVLDNPGSVQKLVAKGSRRAVHQVKDPDSEKTLTCSPTLRYCTCRCFLQVLVRESIMCEHVLAVRLTEALNTVVETEISDEAFADLL